LDSEVNSSAKLWLPEKFVSIDCRVADAYQISGSLLIPALFAFAPYAGAGHFLVFASPKKGSKERRLRAQVWLCQTSLTARGFSGGLATYGFAASNMQALVPRKTVIRSAVPADG